MSKSNAIPIASLSLLLLAVLYLWLISSDPRMVDGGLNGDELTPGETLFTLLVAFSVFAAMFVAMRRAYQTVANFGSLSASSCGRQLTYTL